MSGGDRGSTLEPEDVPRLARATAAVYDVMRDGVWRTLLDLGQALIARGVHMSIAGASARLRDLRKPQYGGYEILRRKTSIAGVFEYCMAPPLSQPQPKTEGQLDLFRR